jgi:CRP-like cAMP-binding protein
MNDTIFNYFKNDNYRRHVKTANFKKDEVVLRPHHDTKFIHYVQTGLVKVYTLDSRGKENIAVIYGPGDFFPLAWIINKNRPSVYFRALTDCDINLVSQVVFRKALEKDNSLSVAFTRSVVEQFALYATSVNNLGLKYGKERVCYGLLVLAARFGHKDSGGYITLPSIRHSDFAATIKTTREGVNRQISRLEKQGVIEYNRSQIVIKDQEYLREQIGSDVPIVFFDSI